MFPGSGDVLPIIITIITHATAGPAPVRRRGHTGTTGGPAGPARIIIPVTAGRAISASAPAHSASAGEGEKGGSNQ